MAWIESHQNLEKHPKLLRLVGRLELNSAEAVGHLHLLWWWCLDYAEDGVIERFSDEEIALAAKYPGDPKRFVKTLIECGFLDESPRKVHDWIRYAGQWLRNRYASSSRSWLVKTWRLYGLKYGDKKATDKQQVRNKKATLTNLTIPNHTRPNLTNQEESPAPIAPKPPHVQFVDRFKQFYEAQTGSPFKYRNHHFVVSKRLIDDHGIDIVIKKAQILAAMCRDRSVWFTKGGWSDFSIEKLSSQWNAILDTAKPPTKEQIQAMEDEKIKRKWEEHDARVSRILGKA